MTLTRVVGKGRTAEMEPAELSSLRASAARTIVDAGTGDGRFAYALASAHPEWLVVGLDALDEPMGEMAHKALRKPAKGGRANVVYVRAAVEELPADLRGIADEVHVLLPWGRLLEGIVLAQADVVEGLAALCRPGAHIDITLNGEIWVESTPARYEKLPVPTPEYVAEVVGPGFARAGMNVAPARYLSADEANALPTTWARRLGHARAHPRFVHFEGSKEA
jgi:16S rRNA (adenine(1408)-N(1))-methyltransferase